MFCFFLFFLTVALTNFLDSSVGKESACNGGVSRDTGSILGSEDPLEEGMAAHSSILAGESRGQRSLARYSPWGCKESDTTERSATNQYTLFLSHSHQMHYWILLVLLSIPPEADLANATIQVPAIIFSFCVAATAFWTIPLLPLLLSTPTATRLIC